MLVTDDKRLQMTDSEWSMFSELTGAPWRPRSVKEFNAMCDLAIARLEVEQPDTCTVARLGIWAAKFDPDGKAHFPPPNSERLAFAKEHGRYPGADELAPGVTSDNVVSLRPAK